MLGLSLSFRCQEVNWFQRKKVSCLFVQFFNMLNPEFKETFEIDECDLAALLSSRFFFGVSSKSTSADKDTYIVIA